MLPFTAKTQRLREKQRETHWTGLTGFAGLMN